jgi:DNA-binding transcriptional regulator GbsR (MarR family)
MNNPSIYSPEFIPFYCEAVEKYGLSHLEGLVYGFVRFYTSSSSEHFYFSNEQLSKILSKSESSVQRAISKLIEVKLFNATYKIRSGGGKIRFITVSRTSKNACSERAKTPVQNEQKRPHNNNKINNNKKKYSSLKDLGEKEFEEIAERYGVKTQFVRSKFEDLSNYCEAKNRRYSNYKAALRNFVKKSFEEKGGKFKQTPEEIEARRKQVAKDFGFIE